MTRDVVLPGAVAQQLFHALMGWSELRQEAFCRICHAPTGYQGAWVHERDECPVYRLQVAIHDAKGATTP